MAAPPPSTTRRTFLGMVGLACFVPRAAFAAAPPRNVTLTASDGVTVYGIRRDPTGKRRRVILLFHQAESSADEYDPIAPRLVELGYATLAIDQRSGGRMYGANETVNALGHSTPYLAAERDVEAALEWAKRTYPQTPLILWGSSYSASLAFVVAANHQGEVAKLLAFSPAEYFGDELHVIDSARRVTAPIFVDTAADAREEADAKRLLDASPSTVKVQYRPEHGIHGSSTLRKDRDPEGYDENWSAALAFLRR